MTTRWWAAAALAVGVVAGLTADATTTPRQLASQLTARDPGAQHTADTVRWLLDLEALRYAPGLPQPDHPHSPTGRAHAAWHDLTQRFTHLHWPRPDSLPTTAPATPPTGKPG